MSAYWTAFAISGDPNGAGRLHWPSYTSTHPEVMSFGESHLLWSVVKVLVLIKLLVVGLLVAVLVTGSREVHQESESL